MATMKKGANSSEIAKIKKLGAAKVPVDQISRALGITPEVIEAHLKPAKKATRAPAKAKAKADPLTE